MANLHRHACLMESLATSIEKFRRYVSEAAIEDRITVALRPHVMIPDLGAEIMLWRDVIVTMDVGDAYTLSWMPSDHGPFPRLTGELRLVADPPSRSRFVLMGDTTSRPSHIAHRVNQAIAKDFLVHLTRRIA